MKKMLVVFLILFTNVLADSEEDKYVDLLPDEEKQQFLEKVARRILKDVESQEIVADAQSKEMSDEQLKQHTEYVKSVLKDEQENIRRSKGENAYENEDSQASEEPDTLGVKPLPEERDLSMEKDKNDIASESTTYKITIDMVTENAPIIKRSVQDDNANKSYESDETTSETFERVSKTNITSEDSNEVQSDVLSTIKSKGITKDSEVVSTTMGDEHDESVSVESNSNESEARNVSVKAIHETKLRRSNNGDSKLAVNTTETNTITSAVEDVQATVNKSDVPSANIETTTLSFPFQTNSTLSTTTEGLISSTESLITTNIDKDSEQTTILPNETSIETKDKQDITKETTRTSQLNDTETTTVKLVPEKTESIPETTESVTASTYSIHETTEFVSKTINDTDIVTTEIATESTTVLDDTIHNNKSTIIDLTEDEKIIVEDFTSAHNPAKSEESTTLESNKPAKTKKKKMPSVTQRAELSEELNTAVLLSDENSMEVTTKNVFKNKVIYKPVIVGPKAKKIAEAKKNNIQNSNFIELEKVYYDNNYKVKVGKEYQVYEIPSDNTPFIKDEEPVADQPYYVPIYNYSPNNAYFNAKNRLGPNAEDSSENNAIINVDDDIDSVMDKTETVNFKMEYGRSFDNKRKKFGSKQKYTHSIHRQPMQNNKQHNTGEKVNPEDYLDSDYYFGRIRKELARKANVGDSNKFPNSDETDHPAHSIQEGNLKDHVRAVRNILFHQKSFGLLEKEKYGSSIEREINIGRARSKTKSALRQGSDNNENDENENSIAIDYYFGREKPPLKSDKDEINNKHIQKVGYVRKHNATKDLYVIDDIFKANVEKYIHENSLTPATPLPDLTKSINSIIKDKIISNSNKESHIKEEFEIISTMVKRAVDDKGKTIENNNLDMNLNLRRNDVIKISVYLDVLKDMVALDNKALVRYDWLGTTVDIQASLQKLFELTSLVANEEGVHPADMEILKYVLFLHKLASEIIEANDFGAQLRKKLVLPRNKKKKIKPRILKEKGLINRVWLYLRKEVPEVNEYGALKNLNKFLIKVEDGLYDLHDAIKNIAKITKYKNQHWYQNLKDLYISTDEKHLLELLLHISALRLFSLIEESAKNGLEDDYLQYMKQNKQHSKRTLEEMMFVMEILDEYNKFVE